MIRLGLIFCFVQLSIASAFAQSTIINYKSVWKYLDNGTDQGVAWKNASFDDASWKSGGAELGYGDGDETTVVNFGPTSSNKYTTTYFRKVIDITNPAQFSGFTLNLFRDDGAVVYINGTEVFRSNMPSGAITYTTRAVTFANDDGKAVQTHSFSSPALTNGANVIAVEIHQDLNTSSDISFDLELIGIPAAVSAPYVTAINRQSPGSEITSNSTLIYRVLFSEKVNGLDYTDFIVATLSGNATGTLAANAVTAVGTDSTAFDVSVSSVSGTGTLRLDLKSSNTGIKNAAGIAINGGFSTGQSYTIDAPQSGNNLIGLKTFWKYLDNGSDQGTAWTGTSFNDASWKTGAAQLGYGDGDESTIVGFGPNGSAKYITTYFRKAFSVADVSKFTGYTLNLYRDDGAIVYINGVEVFRSNMPTGNITFATPAVKFADDDGQAAQTIVLPANTLVAGNNVIAVEIHQDLATSSDISFDLELIGNQGPGTVDPKITRGPYLQVGNENAITFRWRTDIATTTKVEAGTGMGSYPLTASNSIQTTEHEIRLPGLTPGTRYFYRIGNTTKILQGDSTHFFVTAPKDTGKIKVAFSGDCGRNDNNYQTNTLDAYRQYVGNNPAELLILLGDNAYPAGTDAHYQNGFFNAYSGNILRNHVLFPAPGNHDYADNANRQLDLNVDYYRVFTLPTQAECGGTASGTEAYYSFDRGNAHFISLDSYGRGGDGKRLSDTTGQQATWLKNGLAANRKKWVIVFFHHPPYTMGSHNSDTEEELVHIRERVVPILERFGVDLVVTGHSHNYERSYMMRGHLGKEADFDASGFSSCVMGGKYDGTPNSCPYLASNNKDKKGVIYVVAGSSGASGHVQPGYPHNAMPYSVNDGGMFYLEIDENRLNAKFIRQNKTIWDQFTVVKDVNKTREIGIPAGNSVELTASWPGNYAWSNGATTRTISVSLGTTQTYKVTDPSGCLTDVFNVTVTPAPTTAVQTMTKAKAAEEPAVTMNVTPTLVVKGQTVQLQTNSSESTEAQLTDASGRTLRVLKFSKQTSIDTRSLPAGMYFIRMRTKNKTISKKFMVTYSVGPNTKQSVETASTSTRH